MVVGLVEAGLNSGSRRRNGGSTRKREKRDWANWVKHIIARLRRGDAERDARSEARDLDRICPLPSSRGWGMAKSVGRCTARSTGALRSSPRRDGEGGIEDVAGLRARSFQSRSGWRRVRSMISMRGRALARRSAPTGGPGVQRVEP